MKLDYFKNFIILVTGILVNNKGKVLMVRRSGESKTFRGFWQLPEGKIEFGEQPLETLKREFKEELGIRLFRAKKTSVISAVVPFSGQKYHVLRITMEVRGKGKIRLSREHDDFQWIDPKKAVKTLSLVGGTKEILEQWQLSY